MIIKKLDVMDVNNSNISQFNNKVNTEPSVVCFHANWCGHCQQLKPEWDKMVNNIDKNSLSGLLARVEEKNMGSANCDSDIMGYPTIRVFKGGKKIKDYSGKRDAKNLEEFVKKTLGNSMSGGKKKKKRKKSKKKKRKTKRRGRRRKGGRRTRKKRKVSKNSLKERFFKMISDKFN